jgi:hypothetical protein
VINETAPSYVRTTKSRASRIRFMTPPTDIVKIKVDSHSDPDGSELRRALELELKNERMHAARQMLVHILALLGAALWIEALVPELLPRELLLFTVVLWASFFFLTVWVATEEYYSRHKLSRSSERDRR